jgi:hypothetical protein
MMTKLFLTAEPQSSQRRYFALAVRGRQDNILYLFEAKDLYRSHANNEAAFYPAASHGRIKETFIPLRPLQLCGKLLPYMNRFT